MKKVYFISSLDLSLNTAAKKRIICMAKSIEESNVRIVIFSLFNGEFQSTEEILQHTVNTQKRSLSLIVSFFLKVHSDLKLNDNSERLFYLYPTSFQLFDICFILLFKLLFKEKIIVDLNEVRRYNLRFYKRMKWNLMFKNTCKYLLSIVTDFVLQIPDGHVYISSSISKFYKKKTSIIVPILCDNYPETHRKLSSYNINESFIIGFAGSIDIRKEKLNIFFSAVKALVNKGVSVRLNFYGKITDENYFYNELKQYEIQSLFNYNGLIHQEDLITTLQKNNHALILPRGISKQNIFGFSTKLSDYLEAQLPIITSDVGEIGKYFINGKNSVVYKADSVDDLVSKIFLLMNEYNKIAPIITLGGNNLISQYFHYSNYSVKLNSFISNIIE